MKAAQLTGFRQFKFVDAATPRPADGEALIKLEWISVCGSDVRLDFDKALPEEHYPLKPGVPIHECAGTVMESRSPHVKVGQRVIVIPKEGAGGAEYTTQSPERIIALPEWGGLDEWVMCQHTGTVLYSAKKWGNAGAKRIGILGQGGIGLSFTMIAARQGALQVLGIDLHDYRLQKALDLGATDTLNPGKENALEGVKEITKGHGLDVVVDATGSPDGLDTCLSLVNQHGTVISFSLCTPDKITFNPLPWMVKNVKLQATVVAATSQPVKEIREIVALRDRGWIDPGKLKTHTWKWDRFQEAFEAYTERRDGMIKVAMQVV